MVSYEECCFGIYSTQKPVNSCCRMHLLIGKIIHGVIQDLVELTRMTLVGPSTEAKLQSALETLLETTQDFTDSAYTSHENRERILILCERVRQELTILLRIGVSLVS